MVLTMHIKTNTRNPETNTKNPKLYLITSCQEIGPVYSNKTQLPEPIWAYVYTKNCKKQQLRFIHKTINQQEFQS